MLRKVLICLAALFAGGFQTQANAASLFWWNQSVGNAVFPGEMIIQTCLLTKATSYENSSPRSIGPLTTASGSRERRC